MRGGAAGHESATRNQRGAQRACARKPQNGSSSATSTCDERRVVQPVNRWYAAVAVGSNHVTAVGWKVVAVV